MLVIRIVPLYKKLQAIVCKLYPYRRVTNLGLIFRQTRLPSGLGALPLI